MRHIIQGSAQDNLSGGWAIAKIISNCINYSSSAGLFPVSGGINSLSGGKNG